MNQQKYPEYILTIGLIILFLAGCAAPSAAPLPTSVPPTDTSLPTLLPPTDTSVPTPLPPTETPIPLPTSVPGTEFEVNSEGVKLELLAPWCNMTRIGFGTFTVEGVIDDAKSMMNFSNLLFAGKPAIIPNPGDDVLCYIKGEVSEGAMTDAQLKGWVSGGKVYLVNQAGDRSMLVFAGVIEAEQDLLLLFSAPRGYSPVSLQLPDVLVDLP